MKRDGMGRPIQGARGESGLTTRQELNLIAGSLMWPTSAQGRRTSVDLLEDVIAGRAVCDISDQIKAVETYLKVDAMNLVVARAGEESAEKGSEERVVYLLPANGSEKSADFEEETDVVESGDNWAEPSGEAERENQMNTPSE